ncbi:MAG TPA: hypothetical protein VLC08_02345, partial [Chitinolyticbacter sp.]|nr:hypothetical protein [Chitinolyticbacter sp.]
GWRPKGRTLAVHPQYGAAICTRCKAGLLPEALRGLEIESAHLACDGGDRLQEVDQRVEG